MSSAPQFALNQEKQDPLLIQHFTLMRAYSFIIMHTTFPPYSFWIAGSLPEFERAKPNVSFIKSILALMAAVFSTNVLRMWLIAGVTKTELYFPLAMREQVKVVGAAFSFYTMVITFTLLVLNYYLSDPNTRGIIIWSSPDNSNLIIKRIVRPIVTRMGARFVRQHLRSRLDKLISLYRARIATGALTTEQKTSLQNVTEEASKLRDTLPSKWQHVDVLRYPTIAAGLLGFLGFMHGQTMSPPWSILVGCLLLAPYVLARRMQHIALEWEIPLDTSVDPERSFGMTSIYTLESHLFQSTGCSGLPTPARIDVILQVFAGTIATIGCLVFTLQMVNPSAKAAFAFWGILDFAILWFFVHKPVQELRARAQRYSRQRAPVSKLERFITVMTPGNTEKYAFLGSLTVFLIEFGVALYKEGFSFAMQLPLVFAVASQAVVQSLSHSSGTSVRTPEVYVTIQQAHLYLSLFLVWLKVTALLIVLNLIYKIVIYPELLNPTLRNYLGDVIGNCKNVIAFIRQRLRY